MKRRRLGRTDLEVSAICLGAMTWGRQNTEAHVQPDKALSAGISRQPFATANVAMIDMGLPPDVLDGIEAVHFGIPDACS